ncbi:MAG: tetratricopeptide repeat protein [Deltaproteobacteria bacterium]|nr:tetratricopeptide repeat protein [Deltaproteobacteria bacterium]
MTLKYETAFFIAIAVILSIAAFQRNIVWMNELTFWRDARDNSLNKARPHTNLGAALKRKWLIKDAEKEFTIAVRIDPDDHDAVVNLGDIYRINGRLADSLNVLMNFVKKHPTTPYGRNNLGNVSGDMNLYDNALQEYSIALKLKPFFPDAHNNMAVIYKRQGRLIDARRESAQAVDMIPDNPTYRNNLALTLIDMGKYKEALGELNIVEAMEPKYPDIHIRMARLYFTIGDIIMAENSARKAIAIQPMDFKAHVTLGNIYKSTNLDLAIKEYETALAINPDYTEAHYNMAVSLKEMGRHEEALKHYRKFLETAPPDEPFRKDAMKHLERLKK